jgi:acylphosphatase
VKHYRIQVFGRVQGVFFRASTLRVATQLGITGWVKNESDGSVLISAEGEESQLLKLIAWCKQGPVGASVNNINYNEIKMEGHHTFEVRR